MSRGANLSILGLYNHDSSVFDLMTFPDQFTDTQKETTINNILAECAEFEILYPAPDVMKNMIAIWSRKEAPYWNRIYEASLLDYDPIENYHRTEAETVIDDRSEEHSGSDVNTAGGSDTQSGSSTSTDTHSGSDTTDNAVNAYDATELVPHDSSETTYGESIQNYASGTNTNQYGRTDTLRHGEKIDHDGRTERRMTAYGNIGVTTSQEMLTQEMEIAKIIQVIPIIIESFKDRFCLMVY